MKTISILCLAFIIAFASAQPLRLILNETVKLQDVPSCVTDLKTNFTALEKAIGDKKWTELQPLILGLAKVFFDCKDAYVEVESCKADVVPIIGDFIQMFNDVKSKDFNPFDYIHIVTDVIPRIKAATRDCYIKLTKSTLTPIKTQLKDIASCGADLKKDWADFEAALEKKDTGAINDLLKNLLTTFVDCKESFNEMEGCKNDVLGLYNDLATILKNAEVHDLNPMDYISAFTDFMAKAKDAVSTCFKPFNPSKDM